MTEELYGDSYGEKFRKYEDRIADLEKQIEKMKCCTNCRYCIKEWGEFNPNGRHCKKCNKQSEWKLRSNYV